MAVSAPRPYHHGNLREELLAQAERALNEGGVGQLSLRELAREVGVSHAAPRRHFRDKQALLDALAVDGFDRLGAELRDATEGAGADFAGQLLAFARAYVRFATRHAALLELMFAVKHRPGADERLPAAAAEAFAAPLALFGDAQAAGQVVAGDPERVALIAWATLQGLAAMANTGMVDERALDDLVVAAVRQMLAGLQPR